MTPENLETIRMGAELLGGSLIGVLSYFLKSVIADFKSRHDAHEKAAQEQRDRLHEFRLHVAETYTTKDELSRAVESLERSFKAVFEKLDRIEDKLDRKADKSHA